MSAPLPVACATTRGLVHRSLDGDRLSAEERARLGRHLLTCAECRELRDDLGRLHEDLRGLPMPALPAASRAAVLAATVGARRPRRFDWRHAAAAAALGVVMVGLASLTGVGTPSHDPAEVRAAEQQARLVLKLTAEALQRTERAAFGEVLAGEVSPALERVPITWPAPARGRHDL